MLNFNELYKMISEQDEQQGVVPEAPQSPESSDPISGDGMSGDVQNLLDKVRAALAKGAKFATFMYKTNGTADTKKGQTPNGPTKIYKVNLGVSYGNIKDHNLAVIESYEPKDEWEAKAKDELIASLSKPYVPGEEGESVYKRLGKGIRFNTAKGCLNVIGQVTGKAEVVAPGEEKPRETYPFKLSVNKDGSPRGGDKAHIALAKKNINHELRDQLRGGIVSFDLAPEKISGVKVSGDVIEFHSDDQDVRQD